MSTPFFVSSNDILFDDNLFANSSECANTSTNTTCIPNNQQQNPTIMSSTGCFPHEYDPAITTGTLSPSSAAVPIAIPSTTSHSATSYTHSHNGSLLSPFSASDESLYSFSPENDVNFAPSSFGSSMADLMFTDDTTATTTNVGNNTTMLQDQQDFCLNELLGSPVSFNLQPSSFDQQQMSISSPAMSSTSSSMFMQHDMVSPAMSHFETTPFLDHMELGSSLTTPQMGYLDPNSMMAPSHMSLPSSSSSSSSGTKKRRRGAGPKIHYCPHCPHTSNRANNMKEHILTHDPNRPKNHLCPLCGKRFARKHDMKRHAKSPHPSPVSCNDTASSSSLFQL